MSTSFIRFPVPQTAQTTRVGALTFSMREMMETLSMRIRYETIYNTVNNMVSQVLCLQYFHSICLAVKKVNMIVGDN